MKDITKILLKGLVPALATATGKTVLSKVKKDQSFPYVHVSDIFIEEDGPKDKFHYRANVLIEIVFKDQTSLDGMLTTKDAVLSIINNNSPFVLDSPYKIHECSLNTNTYTEELTDTGDYTIGIVMAIFTII